MRRMDQWVMCKSCEKIIGFGDVGLSKDFTCVVCVVASNR